MHTMTQHRADEGTRRFHIWFGMPEHPICWLRGHRPHVYELTSKYSDPSYWIECSRCLRRSTRTIPRDRAVNLPGIVAGTDRRDGWRGRTGEIGVDIITRKPSRESLFSAKFHVGDRWSETPIDAHLDVLGKAIYFNTSLGWRLAHVIGPKRDLALSVHGGSLWWKLWADSSDDARDHRDWWRTPKVWPWSRGRRKARTWMSLRSGSIELNPLDALWGHRYFDYEDLERSTVMVDVGEFPGDAYPVDFTLQRQTRARRHGPAWARRRTDEGLTAHWDSKPGLPVRNHDWKGDEILGSAERVTAADGWLTEATTSLIERVKKDRRRYRYTPPTVTNEGAPS
jgi:hypothetical protein